MTRTNADGIPYYELNTLDHIQWHADVDSLMVGDTSSWKELSTWAGNKSLRDDDTRSRMMSRIIWETYHEVQMLDRLTRRDEASVTFSIFDSSGDKAGPDHSIDHRKGDTWLDEFTIEKILSTHPDIADAYPGCFIITRDTIPWNRTKMLFVPSKD